MNETEGRFNPAYRGTLALVVTQQILLGLLTGMALDGGMLSSMFLSSLVAFWIGFITILVRRPKDPTNADIFLIKWGTFILYVVSIVMSPVIWRLRGAM